MLLSNSVYGSCSMAGSFVLVVTSAGVSSAVPLPTVSFVSSARKQDQHQNTYTVIIQMFMQQFIFQQVTLLSRCTLIKIK